MSIEQACTVCFCGSAICPRCGGEMQQVETLPSGVWIGYDLAEVCRECFYNLMDSLEEPA